MCLARKRTKYALFFSLSKYKFNNRCALMKSVTKYYCPKKQCQFINYKRFKSRITKTYQNGQKCYIISNLELLTLLIVLFHFRMKIYVHRSFLTVFTDIIFSFTSLLNSGFSFLNEDIYSHFRPHFFQTSFFSDITCHVGKSLLPSLFHVNIFLHKFKFNVKAIFYLLESSSLIVFFLSKVSVSNP